MTIRGTTISPRALGFMAVLATAILLVATMSLHAGGILRRCRLLDRV